MPCRVCKRPLFSDEVKDGICLPCERGRKPKPATEAVPTPAAATESE
jgi:hypothetical protein